MIMYIILYSETQELEDKVSDLSLASKVCLVLLHLVVCVLLYS